jgi:hypothetical protein
VQQQEDGHGDKGDQVSEVYEEQGEFPMGRRFRESKIPALKCARCGGEFFMDVNLNKYSADAYSGSAGGDMQVIGGMTHQIRICLCGLPVAPNISGGRVGRGATETAAVVKAVDHAISVHNTFGEHLRVMVDKAVTQPQIQGLQAQIQALETRLRVIEEGIHDLSGAARKDKK